MANTNLKLVHEAEAQRQHVRLKLPLQVRIRDNVYRATDWSMGGVAIEDVVPPLEVGSVVDAQLAFPFLEFSFSLNARLTVRYALPNGKVGLRFAEMSSEHVSLLRYLVDAYISGEVVRSADLMEVSKRNMFVQPRKLPPQEVPASRVGRAARGVRKFISSAMLLAIGIAVITYAVLAVYTNTLVTEGTGIVTSPDLQIARAQISGTLTPYTAGRGKQVAEKEVIAVVEGPDGTIRPVVASCDCYVANEPLPKGSFVSRGTVVARLVPVQSTSLVELHMPLSRLDGLEKHQPVRMKMYNGEPAVWGRIEEIDRHSPIDGAGSEGTYGLVRILPQSPLPARSVGEPVAAQIHRLSWLPLPTLAQPAVAPVATPAAAVAAPDEESGT